MADLTTPIVVGPVATKYNYVINTIDFPNLRLTVDVLLSDAEDVVVKRSTIALTFAQAGLGQEQLGAIAQAIAVYLISIGEIN